MKGSEKRYAMVFMAGDVEGAEGTAQVRIFALFLSICLFSRLRSRRRGPDGSGPLCIVFKMIFWSEEKVGNIFCRWLVYEGGCLGMRASEGIWFCPFLPSGAGDVLFCSPLIGCS